jgi:Zn-dependent metalloprotease
VLIMTEPTVEQNELAEKLKILDKDIKILWKGTGVVSLIDGLITIPVVKDIDESVRHFLMEYSALFGFKKDLSDLKFITKAYGFDTVHIKYQQYYEDIPVLYAFTSVHLNKESKIVHINNNCHPAIPMDTKSILSGGISKEKAIESVHSDLKAITRLMRDTSANLVIYPVGDKFYLAWDVSVLLKNPPESHHVYINVENGAIIKKMDVFRRKTTGKGRVFIPNPGV